MTSSPATHPLIANSQLFVVPGVYDVLSARIAHQTGFHAVVLTGYGVAASHLGRPDFGLFTQTEILDVARRILSAVDIRLVVDGDTGFGGPLNVQRMVREDPWPQQISARPRQCSACSIQSRQTAARASARAAT